MRIIFEDTELEEFVMSGNSRIAVPIEIYRKVGGEPVITVYSCFENEAKEFASRFADDPFSGEALDFLVKIFTPLMRDAGYAFDSRGDYLILKYTSGDRIYNKKCECEFPVVMIETNAQFEKYYNGVTRDVELDDYDPFSVCFAAVSGNAIVSYASVNDISDDESYEINVETVPEERNKGCAAAVVSALTDYITKRGESVSYKCRSSNKASGRVAEKAGLIKDGAGYSFVCYEK